MTSASVVTCTKGHGFKPGDEIYTPETGIWCTWIVREVTETTLTIYPNTLWRRLWGLLKGLGLYVWKGLRMAPGLLRTIHEATREIRAAAEPAAEFPKTGDAVDWADIAKHNQGPMRCAACGQPLNVRRAPD